MENMNVIDGSEERKMNYFSFSLSLTIKSIKRQYKSLEYDDRAIINTYILILIFISLAIIFVSYSCQGFALFPVIFPALSGLAISVNAGIAFSVIDKIGVLTPISIKIENNMKLLNNSIESIRNQIGDDFELLSKRIVENLDAVQEAFQEHLGYAHYIAARNIFGFRSIDGMIKNKKTEYYGGKRDFSEPLAVIFHKAKPTQTIYYVNSCISNVELYVDAITDAVNRGVNVRMMLMTPSEESSAARSRYLTYFSHMSSYDDIGNFIDGIRQTYNPFDEMTDNFSKRKIDHPETGDFQIRYYCDSLDFPLVMIADKGKHKLPYVAYTGFYIQRRSEEMPFVRWIGGEFGFIDLLFEFYNQKWERCEDKKSLRL